MNIIEIAIADIVIGKSFRKDMGDIAGLADSIADLGMLQPIGITSDNELVFGSRRVAAYKHLGRSTIKAHVVEIDNILRGTFAENDMRKDFTVPERVAILKAMERRNNQGRRTDLQLREDIPEVTLPTREQAVVRAGLGNTTTARYATQIVDHGAEELVAAMESGKLPIDRAHLILNAGDRAEQKRILALPAQQQREIISDLRQARSSRGATKKPTRQPAQRRPQAEPLPTYWPTKMTDEERGKPPRETWAEPDPDRPGLTRIQGYTAKHGHVHIMPLAVRQAQDNKIAARRLNSQIKELMKPLRLVADFMASDPPPIDLTTFAATLDAMAPEDVATTKRRLTTTLAELPDLAGIDSLCGYLQRLRDLIAAQPAAEPKEACA